MWLHTGTIRLIEHLSDSLAPNVITSALIAEDPAPTSTPPELLQPQLRTSYLVQRLAKAHYNPACSSDNGHRAGHIWVERHWRGKEMGVVRDAGADAKDRLEAGDYVGDGLRRVASGDAEPSRGEVWQAGGGRKGQRARGVDAYVV